MPAVTTPVRRRPALGAALTGALALIVSACADVDTRAQLAHAADAAREERGVRVAFESELIDAGPISAGAGSRSVGEGSIDLASERMRLAAEVDATDQAGPGDAQAELIVDGTEEVAYIGAPPFADRDADWVRWDLGAFTEGRGPDLGIDAGLGSPPDPMGMLADVAALARDVQEIGTDTVRGDPATHYRMTLDHAAALMELDDDADPERRLELASAGPEEVEAEVWVDEQGRLVRMTHRVDLAEIDPQAAMEQLAEQLADGDVPALSDELGDHRPGQGSEGREPGGELELPALQGTFVTTVELHDYGADVDIELPDDGDVVDLDELDLPVPAADSQ